MNGETISPLRRRMIEDMTVRKFVEKTQRDYIRHVKGLTIFLGRSPIAGHRHGRGSAPLSAVEESLVEESLGSEWVIVWWKWIAVVHSECAGRPARNSG